MGFVSFPSMRRRSLCAALVMLGLTAAPAFAWNDEGHMVVAQIAQGRLNAKAKAQTEKLLAVVTDPPQETERTNTFVSCASWADDIKRGRRTGTWHYRDIPLSLDGTSTASFHQDEKNNVVVAIRMSEATLQSTTATQQQKAEALKYLIHFVGDIHQPLHNTAGINKSLPEGDRGGNDFLIEGPNGERNLHYLWDSGAELLADNPRRPLGDADKAIIEKKAAEVEKAFPYEKAYVASLDPEVWSQESFAAAKTAAYAGIQQGGAPSDAYLKKGRKTAEQQLAKAGYRLAATLNNVLGK